MSGKFNSSHRWQDVNVTLSQIKKLQENPNYRKSSKTFYIEGVRNFVQVVDNNFDTEVIFYSDKLLTAALARKFVRQLRRAGTPTVKVSPEVFRSVSTTLHASGIGAIVRQRWVELADILTMSGLCWIVLERVRSPGNLGTLIRTSEAVGGAGFVFLGDESDPYAPSAVRAAMGATFNQNFVRTNHHTFRKWLAQHHCQVIGASPNGALAFNQISYERPSFLMLGEERKGLSQAQASLCSQLVRIPMTGQADSLNLGVAGSLLMYEVLRST